MVYDPRVIEFESRTFEIRATPMEGGWNVAVFSERNIRVSPIYSATDLPSFIMGDTEEADIVASLMDLAEGAFQAHAPDWLTGSLGTLQGTAGTRPSAAHNHPF